jgi:pheromone shutdown protein TraB
MTKPPVFDFPVFFSNHLLVVAVALVYAPIAPLVGLFGAGAFAVSCWVYKYQLLYVSVTRSETGGRLWNVAMNRVLMATVRAQRSILA